jgi:hypothetical protein
MKDVALNAPAFLAAYFWIYIKANGMRIADCRESNSLYRVLEVQFDTVSSAELLLHLNTEQYANQAIA